MLAVLAAALSLISDGLRDDRDTIATENRSDVPGDAPVEEPRLVEVRCEPSGIVVPVASVQAQRDGLHLRVLNSLGVPTHVTVDSPSDDWRSGKVPVDGPTKEFVQPVAPGQLEIGCEINGERQARRVDLVDPQGYYEEPKLACDTPEPPLRDLPVEPATSSMVTAVRQGLGDRMKEGYSVLAVKGYEYQSLYDPTLDPQAAVFHGQDMVAFVHVRGANGSVGAPYTSLSLVVACPDILSAPTTSSSTASTTPTSAPAT
ncbi:MAG TPA: hypothetical protein VH479_17560 [Acidimicrobiales bacterium]